ncbi:hypothetical protein EZS27_019093 [termite gut metagenome]|uniref:ComEC/Rec2-related protein domain-containing protein n=1 Tax=termite gut metagenome TaxID=433724 RepID=A0A5J4RFJ7_9ZZZZ
MITHYLHKYPFLRLLLPMTAGIIAGNFLFFHCQKSWLWFWMPLYACSVLFLSASYYLKRHAWRWVSGISASLCFFVLGINNISWRLQQTSYTFPETKSVYRAVIMEKPKTKEKYLLCRAYLLENRDSLSVVYPRKNILLYIQKDSISGCLRRGDEVLFSTRLSSPHNNGNPGEFNYARYLAHKAVSGIGFVTSGNWKITANKIHYSLMHTALECRDKILLLYDKLEFQGDELAVLSALTIGYQEELSEGIRESYSVSGASHVLSLSGLHFALLYGFIFFFLKRIPDKLPGIKIFQITTILILIWGFAFITGLTPCIVRSALMCSLFALSEFRRRNYISLNTLAAAGLLMLLYNPCWIFDVGFQLSFCAVASILLLQPRLYRIWSVKNRILKYCWGITTVSIAAQVGAAPLVLLYFSRFSTHFLLTNLLVVTLVTVIMYTAIIMLIIPPLPVIQFFVAGIVDRLIKTLNSTVRWIEQLPLSSMDNIWVYQWEVVGFYIMILLLVCFLHFKRVKYLHVLLVCLLITYCYRTVMRNNGQVEKSLMFYNVRNCPAVHCIASTGESWLTYADSISDRKRLPRMVSRYWMRLHLPEPHFVVSNYRDNHFFYQNNLLYFYGKWICIVNNNHWHNKETVQPLKIDYLYLCKGYGGHLESLIRLFSTKNVIIDSSLSEYYRQSIIDECKRLEIDFVSLAENGAFCVKI